MKSGLTLMLAENPETSRCHDIFTSVPRSVGGTPENTPIATLPVPMDRGFFIHATLLAFATIIFAYVCTVGIGLVFALANMIGGSCGQETWKTDSDTACTALITNSVALSIELRCHAAKPEDMLQEDFDGACGSDALIGFLITLALTSGAVVKSLWYALGKMPSKVIFYDNLFVVQSQSGKLFTCSFYADVTSARSTLLALEIGTKAKVKVEAGGGDNDEKQGKTLTIEGESTVSVLSGHGASRQQFLEEFAKHLPVGIEGFTTGAVPQSRSTTSMLDGRLKDVLKARGGKSSEPTEYDSVRKPITCDFLTELIIVYMIMALAWYAFATVSTLIEWATKRGLGKCLDPLKPGEDMCAVWRIFVPISVPITNPSDYLNLVILVCIFIGAPLVYLAIIPVEYRFHKNSVMQEVLFAKWEYLDNTMVFPSDIEALELVDGSMEKYVKVKTKAHYIIKQGISKPFKITAKFVPTDLKLMLVDDRCASCSGQGPQATSHREQMFGLLHQFKPGFLKISEGTSAEQVAPEPPTQTTMS